MRAFFVFLGKELAEIFKTRKFIAIAAVFLVFAIMSPLTAKFMRDLMKSLAPGYENLIPEPMFTDAYLQFIKNISQIGFITILLAFSGLVSDEKKSGTAMLVLTKGLPRPAFVLSKLTAAFLVYTGVYTVSAGVCVMYTYFLFPEKFYHPSVTPSLLALWLCGLFVIALAHFISSLMNSFKISAIVAVVTFLLLSIAAALPKIGRFIPMALVGQATELSMQAEPADPVAATVAITAGIIAVMAAVAVLMFAKDEINGAAV